MHLRSTAFVLLFVLTACGMKGGQQSLLPEGLQAGAGTPVALHACERRVNDTLAKLEACVQRGSLWRHLTAFQKIADENPGPQGHGNRDAGTPGYKASVDYVAGLMRAAGYNVSVQQYVIGYKQSEGTSAFSVAGTHYAYDNDWFIARNSGDGNVTAHAQPPSGASDGCAPRDFAAFTRGAIALLARSQGCDVDTQVANASAAGAAAVVLYNEDAAPDGVGHEARLIDPATIPVIGVVSNALGTDLLRALWNQNAAHGARRLA